MSLANAFCPFCHSAAVQATRRQRFSTALQAACPICGATGPLIQPRRGETPEQLQRRALAPWQQLAASLPANDVASLTRLHAERAG